MKAFDLVIVGVGGQGTLLTSKILGWAALRLNAGVKVSEVHGMAQRGGSVITHVRVGEHVYAPLVSPGCADFVLAFEELEGARAASFLKPGGRLIVNSQRILPMPVISGAAVYPSDPLAEVKKTNPVEEADALTLAIQAGSQRAVNLVLLGALANHLDWSQAVWEEAITACVPEKTLAVNLKAFAALRH